MTTRVYLQAGRLLPGPPELDDLPAERVFVHAADVPELWVETESSAVPEPGKAVSFALIRPVDVGFMRICGTVERRIVKGGRPRIEEAGPVSELTS